MVATNSYIFILHFLFISFVFLLFCCSNTHKICVYGESLRSHHTIETDMLLSTPTCSASITHPTRRSQEMKISHSYGPCSPLGQNRKYPSSMEIFLKDEARVRSINNAINSNQYHTNTELESDVVPTLSIHPGVGDFTTTIGFGTPKSMFNLIVDTGSYITWTKCKSCNSDTSCLRKKQVKVGKKKTPNFSSSYSNGSCIIGSPENEKIAYMDGSNAFVHYGCDTLFLPPSYLFPKFQFGCGQGSDQDSDKFDGVLGLGEGLLSLTSQTPSNFGKFFSYCFPPVKSSRGHLLFGEKAKKVVSASMKFTPMLKKSEQFYFLSFIGISVANIRLDIPSSVFESRGTVIDSGTVITRLPTLAYTKLQTAFIKFMSNKYPRAPALLPLLDTCYNFEGFAKVEIPEIVLHFGGGADVRLHPSGIVWKDKESLSQVCLAFAKAEDYTIIGNNQQLTLEVVYDLERRRIGFGSNGCSQ